MEVYSVKVEEFRPASDGRPSAGPVYRSVYAKDGLLEPPSEIDCPWDFFSGSVERCPENSMLGHREVIDEKASPYIWTTYASAYETATKIGSAIANHGVNQGDRCGIYGSNCPEWVITMLACNSRGICYVPLYDSLGPNAVEFIVNHAEISISFVQEDKINAILTCLAKCSTYLKTIVSFGVVTDKQKDEAGKNGVSCYSWEEFCSSSEASENQKLPTKQKEDICTIMYTSGTTGEPKGVILKNKALVAEVMTTEHLLFETDEAINEHDIHFSFLPLAHIFDQVMENYCIYKGASIGFWRGDVRYLMEDIQELKPTLFCAVPRVFERIYTGIQQKIAYGGAISKRLFQFAYDYKLKNLNIGLKQDKASPLFDRLVFSKIKQGLGGRVRLMLSGAAPLPKHIEEFLRVTCCSVLIQGYGLTESCAGCITSIANIFPMMGTVGVPVTTIEARLESVPDMGYDSLASTPRGEICLRGHTLFSGYHKRPDLTDEVFADGWFHTGDVGEWLPNGTMKIIDRKKNIFKLSQGEYVAVENLESAYAQCSLVTSVWVYGNSFESFLVGVVVPERNPLEDWATENHISASFSDLCQNLKARKYILDEINATGRAQQLRGFEMLKAIYLEPVPFDMERDLITPTFKLKRPQLFKYYKEHIDKLYQEVHNAKGAAA